MNLAELAIKRPIFISCIVILMLVLGFTSLNKMSVDLFPDVTFPVLSVQTLYPGASPVDMEKLVSKKIEDELASLAGLNKITSINSESLSAVILEFKIGTDIKDAEQQVRQRIGNIRRDLPTDIKEPVVRRFDPADQSIVRLFVASDLPAGQLFDVVDEMIKPQFETINGVGLVSIQGGRKREISVNVDKRKLQDRNLSLLQLTDRIGSTSKDVPVGKVEQGKTETVLRASGEFESLEAIKKVNVNFYGLDQEVRLDSIAEVKEGLEDEKAYVSLMTKANGFQKKPGVFLDIFKQSGANTVKVVDAVQLQLEKANALLKQKNINATVEFVRDNAKPIRLNIADVRESITFGIILCIIVVFFFLGSGRSTFITGMALPNSLLGGFIIMYVMGFSINIMTLLALSLAVGLLIDDAIVVRENIFRHLEMGKPPRQAALDGTNEVGLAVIATTMVVIAVFGPIAFLDGIIGQFFRQFGLTIVFTMLISLFDAFTVAPMLSTYLANQSEHGKRGTGFIDRLLNAFDRMQTRLENAYEKTINWVLDHRKITLGLALFIFVSSLVLIKFIPKNFLPPPDNGEFIVKVEKPVGTSLSSTREFTGQVEDQLKTFSQIDLIATVVGSATGASEPNKAFVYIRLVPKKERKENTTKMKEMVRERLAEKFKDTNSLLGVSDFDISGGNQKIFNLNITGENLDELAAYVDKLQERMKKIPGLVDVDTNYRSGKPEFHVVFERSKSEQLGVSTTRAGGELRARVEGAVAATYREKGREYDIRVRLDEASRDLRENFASTFVPNVNFNMIPLNKVAQGIEKKGYSQINRQNKARYINIDGNLGSDGNLGNITNDVENLLKNDPEFKLPPEFSYRFQGQAEDFRDLLANMLMAMFLGVIFIFLVLASLYESFITPMTILLALPLAITGALAGLFFFNKSLDIFSLIGLILLLGVVAKNSILLVDYSSQLIAEGMDRKQALVKACKTRLRPILMTSLALVAGTIPIAIGLNEASAQRTSMGIAIIGGLVSSTALTLVVVPAAFGYVDDFRLWVNKLINRVRGIKNEPAKH